MPTYEVQEFESILKQIMRDMAVFGSAEYVVKSKKKKVKNKPNVSKVMLKGTKYDEDL